MAEGFDPFWQAAADHAAALGAPAASIFAPNGFEPLLPGCRNLDNPPAIADCNVVILHKGRLGEVPADLLIGALGAMPVSFANEVFLVLSRGGDDVARDNPHVMPREAVLAAALRASQRTATAPAKNRSARMPATYMGQGRVLLETAFGHLMLVDGRDTAIVPHLIRDGWFDRNLTTAISARLKPGMTFVDIGANFGTYTLIGAGLVGEQGRVIAIEPAPAIAALLFESITMNGFAARTDLLRCAVGADNGTATLHEFATRQGSNTLLLAIADAAHADYGETITAREVPCRTLDAIVADLTPERIELVKIDVEGFEHAVLTGARDTLARFRPTLILEWHTGFFAGRDDAARSLHDLLTGELGYRLHRIEGDGTTRPVTFDDLMALGHSDLVAEPAG